MQLSAILEAAIGLVLVWLVYRLGNYRKTLWVFTGWNRCTMLNFEKK